MPCHAISIQFHSICWNPFWFFPLHSNCSIRFDFVTIYSRSFHPVRYHVISYHPIHFNFTQIKSHPFHLILCHSNLFYCSSFSSRHSGSCISTRFRCISIELFPFRSIRCYFIPFHSVEFALIPFHSISFRFVLVRSLQFNFVPQHTKGLKS